VRDLESKGIGGGRLVLVGLVEQKCISEGEFGGGIELLLESQGDGGGGDHGDLGGELGIGISLQSSGDLEGESLVSLRGFGRSISDLGSSGEIINIGVKPSSEGSFVLVDLLLILSFLGLIMLDEDSSVGSLVVEADGELGIVQEGSSLSLGQLGLDLSADIDVLVLQRLGHKVEIDLGSLLLELLLISQEIEELLGDGQLDAKVEAPSTGMMLSSSLRVTSVPGLLLALKPNSTPLMSSKLSLTAKSASVVLLSLLVTLESNFTPF